MEVECDEQREDQHEHEEEEEEMEEMDTSEEQQGEDGQQQIQAEVEDQQQREHDQTQNDQPLTEEEEQNAQRLLLAEYDKLVLQKQELSRRMEVAKIGGEVLDQCLAEVNLKRELEQEKKEHLEQALKDLEKARDLQLFQEAKTGEDMKWQKEMMANFSEFCEEDDEEDKALAEYAQQAEEMAKEFEGMRQNEMPWIAEKAAMQKELELEEDRMTKEYEEISKVDKKIAVARAKLAGHEEIPFKTFCLTLANYHQKSTHLEKLIMREHKLGKELDAKLQEKRKQSGMLSSLDSAAILDATLETSSNFSLEMSRQLQPASASDDLFQQQSTSAAAVKSVHFGAVNTKPLTPSTVTNSAEGSTNTNGGGGGDSDLLFKVPELLPKRRASPQLFDFSQEEEEGPQPSGSNSQPANGQANRVVNLSADNLSFMDGSNFLDDDNAAAAAGEGDEAADAVPTKNMFEHFHFG